MNDFVIVNVEDDPFYYNLNRYGSLVEEIEGGYGMCLSEYTNDLYCRSFLQEKLDEGFVPNAAFQEQLDQLDERLRALLIPTIGSIHGSYPPAYFWFLGVPGNAEEVIEEVRGIGALA